MPTSTLYRHRLNDSFLSSQDIAERLSELLGRRKIEQLRRALESGAELTRAGSAPALRRRVIWWPAGVSRERQVAVISSRLEGPRWSNPAWFAHLRCFVTRLHPADRLLVATGCTAERYLERLAERQRQPVVRLDVSRRALDPARWLKRVTSAPASNNPRICEAYLSPELLPDDGSHSLCESSIAPGDQWLIDSCDELLIARLRRGSSLWPALLERLERNDGRLHAWFASGAQLVEQPFAELLLTRGAASCRRRTARFIHHVGDCITTDRVQKAAAVLRAPRRGGFLFHCTRAHDGPWPGEPPDRYLDALLFQRPESDHSPYAALRRIVQQQCIRASAEGIRGAHPVVCWTEATWDELPKLRRYRTHRMRWDFLPYGIAIDRRWLIERGAAPVIYGDEDQWRTLVAYERPFFQIRSSSRSSINWTSEREWRCPSDVPLDELGTGEAFLFVPTRAEAKSLARISRWPVVYTNGE